MQQECEMKEILDVVFQGAFLLIGLGLAAWLLYYAFRSGEKSGHDQIELKEIETKKKSLSKL